MAASPRQTLKQADKAFQAGDYEEALNLYKAYLADRPKEKLIPEVQRKISECNFRLGEEMFKEGSYGVALYYYDYSDRQEARDRTAQCHLKIGDQRLAEGDVDGAIDEYKASGLAPEGDELLPRYKKMATELHASGRYGKAFDVVDVIPAGRRGDELQSLFVDCYLELSRKYLRDADYYLSVEWIAGSMKEVSRIKDDVRREDIKKKVIDETKLRCRQYYEWIKANWREDPHSFYNDVRRLLEILERPEIAGRDLALVESVKRLKTDIAVDAFGRCTDLDRRRIAAAIEGMNLTDSIHTLDFTVLDYEIDSVRPGQPEVYTFRTGIRSRGVFAVYLLYNGDVEFDIKDRKGNKPLKPQYLPGYWACAPMVDASHGMACNDYNFISASRSSYTVTVTGTGCYAIIFTHSDHPY
jgi:tetratricopeptide (TPR) repeat protein